MSTATMAAPSLAAITDTGMRCILCDRLHHGEPLTWHTWVMRDTEPKADCSCDGTHKEPGWHGFEVVNSRRDYCGAAGLVCPECVADKGLDAAVLVALTRMTNTERNTN